MPLGLAFMVIRGQENEVQRLSGKIAFVTGAGGGIGNSICGRFLEEGALVTAADLSLELATLAIDGAKEAHRAIAVQCDVGDSASVRAAIAKSIDAFGSLNVICNVAGGSTSADGPVTEAPEEEFWRAIRLDLFGTFLCCKYGIPALLKAGGGSVINMTSMAALTAVTDRTCYAAAKGGVIALTRSMAADYARHSVRANAIAPGITLTSRIRSMMESGEGMGKYIDRHLLGLVEPVDVANMAVYLASDESRVVTGQVLAVDSGVTI